MKHRKSIDMKVIAALLILASLTLPPSKCLAQNKRLTPAQEMCNRAADLESEGKFDEAVALYNKSLALAPNEHLTHFNLALAYLRRNDNLQAKHYLQKSLQLNPQYPDAWVTQGLILKRLGDLAGAEAAYKKALVLKPNHFMALVNLSSVYILLKRWRDEQQVLLKASVLPEFSLPAYKDFRDNLETVTRGLDKDGWPESGETVGDKLCNRGLELRKQGKIDEAIVLFKKALELEPNEPTFYFNLGRAYEEKSDGWLLAKQAYEHALKLKPEYVQALNQVGLACKHLDDFKGSEAAFKRALSLKPTFFEALVNLSGLYAGRQMWKESQECLVRASKLPEFLLPENKDVRDDLDSVNKRLSLPSK